ETAAKSADASASAKERELAYERHREVIQTLKALLAKFDSVKTLDQAAERLEASAKEQLELHLKSAGMAAKVQDFASDRVTTRERVDIIRSLQNDGQGLADQQRDLRTDVANTLKQLDALKDQLPADQQERLKGVKEAVEKQKLLDNMNKAADDLANGKRSGT